MTVQVGGGISRVDIIRWSILFLALLGVVVSSYSLYQHVSLAVSQSLGVQAAPSFCNINSAINCDAVNSSEWSKLFGLPLASYGIVFYSFISMLALMTGGQRGVPEESFFDLGFAAGIFACVFSLWLFCVSEFIVGSLCLLCIVLYGINAFLLLLAWIAELDRGVKERLLGATRSFSGFFPVLVTSNPARSLAWICVICGMLVAGVTVGAEEVLTRRMKKSYVPNSIGEILVKWRNAKRVEIKRSKGSTPFGDYAKGQIAAPVQIVEFADYECPGCRRFSRELREILKDFEGRYYLTFRNYPLDKACNPGIKSDFHQFACFAATIARCAGEQGKFWEASDILFDSVAFEQKAVSREIVEQTLLGEVVDGLNLDKVGLASCVNSGRYQDKFLEDIAEGDRLGLEFTPSVWVNGRLLAPTSSTALRQILEESVGSVR